MHIRNLGTISQRGRILQVHNADIIEILCNSNTIGHLSIIYANELNNDISETLKLNVSINTVILNSFGHHMTLSDIKENMMVDSLFTRFTNRLIPPQSNALLIVARNYNHPPLSFIIDRIAKVDIINNILYTGNPNNIDEQIKFNISNLTTIRKKDGNPVPLHSLHPGILVDVIVIHYNFQTPVIPYEAEALHIQIL